MRNRLYGLAFPWLVWMASWAIPGFSQMGPVNSSPSFDNPPLLYRGPDPTSHVFLPSRVAMNQADTPLPFARTAPLAPGPTWQEPFYPAPPLLQDGSMETFLPPPVPHVGPFISAPGPGDPMLLDNWLEAAPASTISPYKDGFFQKLGHATTWLDRNNKVDDYGVIELDNFISFAVPLPNKDWPLLITPVYNVRLVHGPKHIDFPAQLYEAYLDLLWVPKLSERWTGLAGIAGGWYGDFKADNGEMFRISGKALARYDWEPGRWQIIFGVLYPNRDDYRILPGGGVIWTPSPDHRLELLFPLPKIARRILIGPYFEDWIYLGGEFGGNSFAVLRQTGLDDRVTLRDYRVYFGLERKKNGGAGYRIEIGFVFEREMEFDSATPDVLADPTAMLRGGITF